jgi:hypothetical protein
MEGSEVNATGTAGRAMTVRYAAFTAPPLAIAVGQPALAADVTSNCSCIPESLRCSYPKTEHPRDAFIKVMYCGPVLRHPAEFMLPAVDLGGRVWLGDKPCKGGPAAPAFGGWRR